MGQYYTPVILDEDGNVEKQMCSWDFDSGLKLMEHSWINNDFVAAFETLLCGDMPRRVVWAGDYADPERNADGTPVMRSYTTSDGETRTYEANLYNLAEDVKPYRPAVKGLGEKAQYDWYYKNGKRRKNPKITKVLDPEITPNATPLVVPTLESHPYLLNWDKKQFVDKRKGRKDKDGWKIHPLPLLTNEGNNGSGGDFHIPEEGYDGYGSQQARLNSGNFALIGSWARDHISVSTTAPVALDWVEIDFDLAEG